MLAYLKTSMGYTTLCNKRVYGKYFSGGSFGPTEFKRKEFLAHQNMLEEAPITQEYLSAKINKDVSIEPFKCTDVIKMEYDNIIKLAKAIGVKYSPPGQHRRDQKEKQFAAACIRKFIDGLVK